MPSVKAAPGADCGWVSQARAVSGDAHPSNGARRAIRARRILHGFFAGLNRLLKIGDFSRGDDFRC